MKQKSIETISGKKPFKYNLQPYVFFSSAATILLILTFSLIYINKVSLFFNNLQSKISNYTGWFYILTVNLVLLFIIYLLFSKFRKIRLGGKDSKPEFSLTAWFAMLFSAGMGIGLLFYSVAEPILHFISAPNVTGMEFSAAKKAMNITFLHWGLHPWAVYALVGLALAFFSQNKKYPLTIRTAFYPIFGDKINGTIGHIIDSIAAVATLFGVATSLGLGVQQVNAGLEHVFGIQMNTTIQLVLIAGITSIATLSVVLGLDGGIKRISKINMFFAFALLIIVMILGPTRFIFKSFVENTGSYLQNFIGLSSWTEAYQKTDWQRSWTIFYWGWWIAWAPFVGMFIARISKGRTLREFITGVLLVPTLLTFIWITVFGNSALSIELTSLGSLSSVVQSNVAISLFEFLEQFPFAKLTCILGILVVIMFFVTSSDSGSLVIDIITAGGHQDPPVVQRIFWAVLEGVVAAILLVGGGLGALQTMVITTGLPMAILLLILCFSLLKGLRHYHQKNSLPKINHKEIINEIRELQEKEA